MSGGSTHRDGPARLGPVPAGDGAARLEQASAGDGPVRLEQEAAVDGVAPRERVPAGDVGGGVPGEVTAAMTPVGAPPVGTGTRVEPVPVGDVVSVAGTVPVESMVMGDGAPSTVAGDGIDPAERTPRSFHLSRQLLERARAAAHWAGKLPDLDEPTNVSELVERALRGEVERLERTYNAGVPFPAVQGKLRTGPGASGVERIRRAQRARRRRPT